MMSYLRRSVTTLITKRIIHKSSVATAPNLTKESLRPWNEIPGPKSYPLIKNLPYTRSLPCKLTDIYAICCHMREKYGEIVRWELPIVPRGLFIFNPDLIEQFLKEGVTEWPERPPLQAMYHYRNKLRKSWHGDSTGLILENGEKWYKVRSKVQQTMLRPKSSRLYIPAMDSVAQDFIQTIRRLRDEKMEVPKNFQNELYKWALESVGVVAFNTRLGCFTPNLSSDAESQIMITSVSQAFEDMSILETNTPYWRFFPSKRWRSLVKHMDNISQIGIKHIDKAAAELNKKQIDELKDLNMLERFLTTPGLSKSDAYTMAMDMLFAGIDTTGNSMGYVLYCLAKHPDHQKKAQEEIDKVMPDPKSPVTLHGINSLTYLKACIKETMRLHPIVSAFIRLSQKDVSVKGYHIPKGTFVLGATMYMSLQEKHYPDSMKFKPERWLRGHPDHTNASPYTYLPFGHGTRMCIGRRIAEQEMWILTTKILQNFNIEYHYNDMSYIPSLINIPSEPLQFRFLDRTR